MYDAILVLGKKLNDQNQLIDGSKAMVQKAVELFEQGKATKIILSGRWYYKLDTQPITEAQAMADYAKSLGLPDSAIVLEDQSDSTVSNIYFTKKILRKNNWKKIILINHYPFEKRALMTAHKVLGPEYDVRLELSNYILPEPKHSKYITEEKEKCETMKKYYRKFVDGDEESIYQGHLQYMKDNGYLK